VRPPDPPRGRGLSSTDPGGLQVRDAAGLCPRCREPFDAEQEYCLDCGLRLPWESVVFTRLTARTAARTRFLPRDWIWPAALALVVAAAGAAAAIAFARDDSSGRDAFAVATGGNRPVAPATTVPATPGTTGARGGGKVAPAKRAGLIRWPRGRNAWTIVLISLPQTGGGAPARAKAEEALGRGLREVGVIDSSRFASLHPGYYVVFTGVYASEEEATGALQRAKAVFPLAYTREVAA
jgi:hypothetical protein